MKERINYQLLGYKGLIERKHQKCAQIVVEAIAKKKLSLFNFRKYVAKVCVIYISTTFKLSINFTYKKCSKCLYNFKLQN